MRTRRQRPEKGHAKGHDRESLERLALHYAGRYATSGARLVRYLKRKVAERGWEGDEPSEAAHEIDGIAVRFAELGYVDDRAFAEARADALIRRGYGARRIEQDLRAAGIDEEQSVSARARSRRESFGAALRFAQRKRIGPFAATAPDRAGREKAAAAMIRAGHDFALVRRFVDAAPGETPDENMEP